MIGAMTLIFMPPTSKKMRRHIGLGLSDRPSVHYACTWSKTVRDRTLKFGMWDEYENLEDPYIFSCPSDLRLQSYCPFFYFFNIESLWKLVNKISQEPLEPVS